ncbi:hypothetical protein HGRIS_001175 [Hohenbuehelia grisea]|uniref:Uncharacterized protein n=1 Tax=Hohenbuehelia grisea TaxID=104357 RepID=A0ABR3JPS1_9AGAR
MRWLISRGNCRPETQPQREEMAATSFIHSTAYHYGSMPLIPESDISVGISVDKTSNPVNASYGFECLLMGHNFSMSAVSSKQALKVCSLMLMSTLESRGPQSAPRLFRTSVLVIRLFNSDIICCSGYHVDRHSLIHFTLA